MTVTISDEEFRRLKAKAGEPIEKAAPICEGEHAWKFIGGANAGCCSDCACSVSVYECAVCKFCDYGDNEESRDIIANCDDREEMEHMATVENEQLLLKE